MTQQKVASDPIVYVVDDEDSVRQSVAALVQSMNYRCQTFASGSDFLANLNEEEVGVLVVDLRMPGMDGLQVQKRLLEGEFSLPVVFITAYADVSVAVRAMARGAVTMLEKPYDENELWQAIRRAVEIDTVQRERRLDQLERTRRLAQLSVQEEEVMRLIVAGTPNKVIASRLDVSLRTIEERRRQVFRKTDTTCVADLVRFAMLARQDKEDD